MIRLPNACGLLAIVVWSLFPLLMHFIHGVPSMQIGAMGFSVASLGGIVLLAARKRLAELKQPPLVWLHGAGGIFGYNALLFAAMVLAPPPQALAINYAWPCLTVLLSAFVLKIRLTWVQKAGLALGFAGCAVLALKGEQTGFSLRYAPGYLCAFLSAFVWALYSALSCKMKDIPSGALTGFYAACAVLSAAGAWRFEQDVMPDTESLLAILILGIGPLGIAYFLWDYGVKHGNPILLGAFSTLFPALSYLSLAVPGYAPLGPLSITALGLVVIGGAITLSAKTRPIPAQQPGKLSLDS